MENNNVLPVGCLLQGGHYQVERHLGSGGFGNTYKIIDTTNGAPMAMKEFYLKGINEREFGSRTVSVSNADNTAEFDSQKMKFRKEALRLSGLHHPNVVQVYDLFEENGTAYYVMDYVQGKSLSACMRSQEHPFTEAKVLDVTRQLLDALEAVHAQNIWHLDLKPGNVMEDDHGHVILIDFGASKQFHDAEGRSLSTSTGLCYTPGYAPTEQIAVEANRIGPWTDLYALGATMYNLLTMQTPPSVSAIQDGESFNFPTGVSTAMQRLIRWLMEPNRKNRPQSVDEVRTYIENNFAPKEETGEVTKLSQPETAIAENDHDKHGDSHRNRKLWILLAAGAAIAVAAILFFMLKGNKHHDYDDDIEEEMLTEQQMEESDNEQTAADNIANNFKKVYSHELSMLERRAWEELPELGEISFMGVPCSDCEVTSITLSHISVISETTAKAKARVVYESGDDRSTQTNDVTLILENGSWVIDDYDGWKGYLQKKLNEARNANQGNSTDFYDILSVRKLTESDITGLSSAELALMRNYVYARHGYRFTRDDLFRYFSQLSWYTPTTSNMTTVYNEMSEIERYNIDFIKSHE